MELLRFALGGDDVAPSPSRQLRPADSFVPSGSQEALSSRAISALQAAAGVADTATALVNNTNANNRALADAASAALRQAEFAMHRAETLQPTAREGSSPHAGPPLAGLPSSLRLAPVGGLQPLPPMIR